MAKYDLHKQLSWLDFESLSKDLLEAELGVRLENFREGADRGIDLRHAPAAGTNLIVQCKRYSDYSNLKRVMIKEEKPKLLALKPTRYILTTSVSLSPMQVDELMVELSPHVRSTDDIYGADRLNGLLTKHSDVERRHVKLWLQSAGVLDAILNARTHRVSQDELGRTIAAAKVYVSNPSYKAALEILAHERVCIISGQPGIGKTTLARMLMLYFHAKEFDIVKIESDVSEAQAVDYHERPRFFFYDDFLGQTAQADKLNKNEDQKLIDFMRSVHAAKHSVVVLTTREYILNQAKLTYEKFDREHFDHRTCVIDLIQYSRRIRAEILYNHLHFSDLPESHRISLITSGSYRRIIDHPNYNPRLIETVTRSSWVGGRTPDDYVNAVQGVLANPAEIWAHAYSRQLSHPGRHVLAVLATLPSKILLEHLRKAFDALHVRVCTRFGLHRRPDDLMTALKELDGTFVGTNKSDEGIVVSFRNPSVRDFMHHQLLTDQELLPDFVGCAVFYEQAQWFSEMLAEANPRVPVKALMLHAELIAETMGNLLDSPSCQIMVFGSPKLYCQFKEIDRAERLASLARASGRAGFTSSPVLRKRLRELAAQCSGSSSRREILDECIPALPDLSAHGSLDDQEGRELVDALTKTFLTENADLKDYHYLAEFMRVIPDAYSAEQKLQFRETFLEYLPDHINGLDYSDPQDFRDAATMAEHVGKIFETDIAEHAELLRDRAREIEDKSESDWTGEERTAGSVEHCSDADLDSMFRTLL